jgi:hypothetical protein
VLGGDDLVAAQAVPGPDDDDRLRREVTVMGDGAALAGPIRGARRLVDRDDRPLDVSRRGEDERTEVADAVRPTAAASYASGATVQPAARSSDSTMVAARSKPSVPTAR